MLDNRVLNAIRKMKRLDEEYRHVDDVGVIRRISLNAATRSRLAESYARVLNWDAPEKYGVTIVRSRALPGPIGESDTYYLVVVLDRFFPESAAEFDRVFFDGEEPRPKRSVSKVDQS